MARRWRKFCESATSATGAFPRPRMSRPSSPRPSSPRPCRPSPLSVPQYFCLLPLFVPRAPLAGCWSWFLNAAAIRAGRPGRSRRGVFSTP
eukprot:7691298-Pyramimonas_sp.AAC.1